jgi:hypothetical protein
MGEGSDRQLGWIGSANEITSSISWKWKEWIGHQAFLIVGQAEACRTGELMDFGAIKRPDRAIDHSDWQRLIADHIALEPVPDREMINPFTKVRIVASGAGKAYYSMGKKRVGNLSLEDGVIRTSGVPRDFCVELARTLGAEVLEDDRS